MLRRVRGARLSLRVALLVLTLAAGGAGCRRGPRVVSVAASVGAHEDVLRTVGLDQGALAEAARDGLGAAGFRVDKADEGYRARLALVGMRRRIADDGVSLAEVAVDLELTPAGALGSPVLETGVGVVRMPGGTAPELWREALQAAARQAAAGLAMALSEEAKSSRSLIGDLTSRDARQREQAIRVLGDRRSAEAVPALVARLGDPEPLLAERAAGALAQIRDPRAVAPLIDYSRRNDDPLETARFARIIGDIGGSEARGYLQTLESGHLDLRVRSAAREALEELDAREREQGRLTDGRAGRESPAPDSGRMER